MTIVVEDGSGKPDAVSLCSVTAADAYHLARSNAAWAGLVTADKESALIRATDYLSFTFTDRWAGTRVTSTQALDWPRACVPFPDAPGGWGYFIASNTVPLKVVNACAELALKASAEPLLIDEGPAIKSFKEGDIGPVGGDMTVYVDGARQNLRFVAVEMMVRPYLSGGGSFGSIRVVRA